MTGRGIAVAVDDLGALEDIAADAGVSRHVALRVLAAAGKRPAMTVIRLMGSRSEPAKTSAAAVNRRAG